MDRVHQLENEIYANCTSCSAERLLAYWDEELECYIYLCDEEPLCNECMSQAEQSDQANRLSIENTSIA